MKISLILLTYNRLEPVKHCFAHNKSIAGYPYHEVIHVDNGSYQSVPKIMRDYYGVDTQIVHKTNLGVSKGYNRGYLNARGTHVLITGMDRLLPDNWLKTIAEHFEKIPQTGVISIYGPPVRQDDNYAESRFDGPEIEVNGLTIQPSLPFEARICSKEFFLKCGFLREDFEMYGYEDNEWGFRANRVAKENGMINYIIPSLYAEHYKEDQDFEMSNGQSYRSYKDSFLESNAKKFEEIRIQNFPYYNPYF